MNEQYEQQEHIYTHNEEEQHRAIEARAVVVAAEQSVRVAVEQAREVTLRLERLGSGRHLAQELVRIEAEIDRAWQELHEAERAFQRTQVVVQPGTMAQMVEVSPGVSDTASSLSLETPEIAPSDTQSPGELLKMQGTQVEQADRDAPDEDVHDKAIERVSREEIERIEHIDEEEEMLAMSAAMTTADVAAAVAAQAEAFAEASSARVREVRRLAERADEILEQVEQAIRRGMLTGDAAEATHRDAEHDVNYAHTLLAEAENTEARARRAAMDAEAEAEVAEGMATATQGRFAHGEYRDVGEYVLEAQQNASNQTLLPSPDSQEERDATEDTRVGDERVDRSDRDTDDTLKLPSLRLPTRQKRKPQDTSDVREPT